MSRTSQHFGFELLHQQVLDNVEGLLMWLASSDFADYGDTEIEKLLFRAIFYRVVLGLSGYKDIIISTDAENEAQHLADTPDIERKLFLRPQAEIGEYRVDFLLHAINNRTTDSERVWRRLVIECDGHEFHERTKEQAAKDRSRDRWLTAHDYDVFRFTGSELWRDPWGCAMQVMDWAKKGRQL